MNSQTKLPAKSMKLTRSRLSDQAARELKHRIAVGLYASGSRLPTEAELAEELGVTRLTVREALAQLEASGFTVARHGSGTYVVDLEHRTTFRILDELLLAGRDISADQSVDLMEFRTVVILGFVPSLVANARAAHVEALRSVLVEARASRLRPEELAALDHRFNEVLAQASNNSFYVLLVRSMREIHQRLGAVIFRELGDDEAILLTLEAIASALEAKKAARLERALDTYLAGGARIVREWIRKGHASGTTPHRTRKNKSS